MSKQFTLSHTLADNVPTRPKDVLAAKQFLYDLGFYEPPEWGITQYPDHALINAIRDFQRANGLRVDGVMKPGGESEDAIQQAHHAAARQLQGMGRHGDTLLAHITPEEARMLKARGGAGTVNPATGLLEFYTSEKKTGTYIWRTVGDSKVRSTHAERNGKVFSWDNPPEGGHPGEDYNCRCRAEEIEEKDCSDLKFKLDAIERKLIPVEAKVSNLRAQIDNKKIEIEVDLADIEFYEYVNTVATFGGLLTMVPHPLGRFAGWAFQVGEKISEGMLHDIRASLAGNWADLGRLENALRPHEDRLKDLEGEKRQAEAVLRKCEAGK